MGFYFFRPFYGAGARFAGIHKLRIIEKTSLIIGGLTMRTNRYFPGSISYFLRTTFWPSSSDTKKSKFGYSILFQFASVSLGMVALSKNVLFALSKEYPNRFMTVLCF